MVQVSDHRVRMNRIMYRRAERAAVMRGISVTDLVSLAVYEYLRASGELPQGIRSDDDD